VWFFEKRQALPAGSISGNWHIIAAGFFLINLLTKNTIAQVSFAILKRQAARN